MSREGSSAGLSPNAASTSADVLEASISEDSNNNTSLVNREQPAGEGTSASSRQNGSSSPAIREIHKNSWLKRLPCAERWQGRFPKGQKPEKFWVVFCVHDDKDAFLEFYENRRSAYSHLPISSVSLAQCLHISPTIVAQENEHEFVVTLESQVVRLAASTNEQMLEWMDTMKTKLRELGVLEPKDNLYSREPITSFKCAADNSSEHLVRDDFGRLSVRDPNSPLPPVPSTPLSSDLRASSAVVFVRNPSVVLRSPPSGSIAPAASSPPPSTPPGCSSSSVASSDPEAAVDRLSRSGSLASQESLSPAASPTAAAELTNSEQTLYEPLFCAPPPPPVGMGIRNPNYENPPPPLQRSPAVTGDSQVPALPPREVTDGQQRRFSSSVASDIHFVHSDRTRSSGLSQMAATSDPSLHASEYSEPVVASPVRGSPSSRVLLRSQSQQETPTEEGPPPYNSPLPASPNMQGFPEAGESGGRPVSLREAQVQKLLAEITHKSGVRLVLRKKDCINAIALVECFNYVWVAGWKQKEHPLLHNTFHVGDRLMSIAGQRIQCVQDAHKAIKHQSSIVEFVVRRVPCGRVLAIKREYEGQDLGIVREGGTAEIKEVKLGGLASRHGLPTKAPNFDGSSLCNWFLTEINHRPLNLFFKDNEVHDRLNAVGLDISILVQPIDLVKALKKQLKALRSYKDYIVQ